MLIVVVLTAMACRATVDDSPQARDRMVDLIASRGVDDRAVLEAMRAFPRHELVPAELRSSAYQDRPLPIGFGQTISQPYMVAVMTAAADLQPGEKVLEIGTGSGYQAAILAGVGARVFSIEIVAELAKRAGADLERLGVDRVTVRHGDGFHGWPGEAPFAAIVVTAAPEKVPAPLLEQLADGGRLVIPVGSSGSQWLDVYEKRQGKISVRREFAVRFVPMTGRALEKP